MMTVCRFFVRIHVGVAGINQLNGEIYATL